MEAITSAVENASPPPPADQIAINPDAYYSEPMLAGLFRVKPRTVRRWREARGKQRFPSPFYLGNRPHWRGKVLQIWLNNRQQEALS